MGEKDGGTGVGRVEQFRPTSGQVTGVLGLVVVGAFVVLGLLNRTRGFPLPLVAAALVVGVLVWASLLRPRVWATEEDLVMRNMLHTAEIPLAAIEKVVVRQVLAVSAGERRYVSAAVGKSRRDTIRSDRLPGATGGGTPQTDTRSTYPAFVEDRIARLAAEARARHGIAMLSDEQLALAAGVRRRWAWPEVAALVVAVLLLVVSLLL